MVVSQSHSSVSSFLDRTDVSGRQMVQLNVLRYTKPKGQLPDYASPIVLKNDAKSVDDLCMKIHKTLQKDFKWLVPLFPLLSIN